MKDGQITLIFGRIGSGKSTLAKELMRDEERLIVVDPLAEYNNGVIVNDMIELHSYMLEYRPEKFKIICRFDNDLDMEYLFKYIFELENVCLVLEECEMYISPQAKSGSFLRLIRYGRHKDIRLIGIARRPSELSADMKAQVTRAYSYQMVQPLDIQIMKGLGFSRIESLNKYEFELVEYG